MGLNKIKVAYIITPISFGGAERVNLNFLRQVDRNHFDILPIFLIRPWEKEPYFVREINRFGFHYETVPVALKPRSSGKDHFRLPRVVYRFYSILRKGSFDLVHTHGYFADICALPVARLLGICTLSTCHGFISGDNKLRTYNKLDKYFLRLCGKIIAVSEEVRNELIRGGIKDSKIFVIPNAVESSFSEAELSHRNDKRFSLNIAPDDFVVGYLGRLSQEKGVNYLIDAVSEIRDSGVQVKLVIVGDGPERDSLEHKVKNNGLENLVVFAGFQEDIKIWLQIFDVFVLPSLTEGTPMALLEAMAMRVPVIATAVGGVPQVVNDQKNGLTVPPGDHQAISNALNMLKNDSELYGIFAKAGVNTIKAKFSIDKWCRKIEKIYLLSDNSR